MTRMISSVLIQNGRSMTDYLREEKPDEMSLQEKGVLCIMLPEAEPLPFSLKELKMAYGPAEEVYDIPKDDKPAALRDAWPFACACPSMEDELFDLHEEKCFKFRDAQIIRYSGRNMMVSPYYASTGGMAVDFVPKNQMGGDTVVMDVRDDRQKTRRRRNGRRD